MTELQRLARRLADDYQFECQGGPLRNCQEWRALCEAIDTLAVDPPPSGASPQAETSEPVNLMHALRKGLEPYAAPVSPVEPEPPTTCRCLNCEPLTDPGPKPSEDDINRLEKAAWDSKTDRVLVWYRDRAEMFRQRLRETERAWQLDRKKPTVAPEPCVWREFWKDRHLKCRTDCGREMYGGYPVGSLPQPVPFCPFCAKPLLHVPVGGAPLKVEREP